MQVMAQPLTGPIFTLPLEVKVISDKMWQKNYLQKEQAHFPLSLPYNVFCMWAVPSFSSKLSYCNPRNSSFSTTSALLAHRSTVLMVQLGFCTISVMTEPNFTIPIMNNVLKRRTKYRSCCNTIYILLRYIRFCRELGNTQSSARCMGSSRKHCISQMWHLLNCSRKNHRSIIIHKPSSKISVQKSYLITEAFAIWHFADQT